MIRGDLVIYKPKQLVRGLEQDARPGVVKAIYHNRGIARIRCQGEKKDRSVLIKYLLKDVLDE